MLGTWDGRVKTVSTKAHTSSRWYVWISNFRLPFSHFTIDIMSRDLCVMLSLMCAGYTSKCGMWYVRLVTWASEIWKAQQWNFISSFNRRLYLFLRLLLRGTSGHGRFGWCDFMLSLAWLTWIRLQLSVIFNGPSFLLVQILINCHPICVSNVRWTEFQEFTRHLSKLFVFGQLRSNIQWTDFRLHLTAPVKPNSRISIKTSGR